MEELKPISGMGWGPHRKILSMHYALYLFYIFFWNKDKFNDYHGHNGPFELREKKEKESRIE